MVCDQPQVAELFSDRCCDEALHLGSMVYLLPEAVAGRKPCKLVIQALLALVIVSAIDSSHEGCPETFDPLGTGIALDVLPECVIDGFVVEGLLVYKFLWCGPTSAPT